MGRGRVRVRVGRGRLRRLRRLLQHAWTRRVWPRRTWTRLLCVDFATELADCAVFDLGGGRSGFYFAGGGPPPRNPSFHPRSPPETDRERADRLRRQSEERAARERLEKERARIAREYAEQRRQEGASTRCHDRADSTESAKAAERRQSKKTAKRDRANAEREAAATRAREAKTLAQSKRSAVFAAAREGRSDVVRRAVWEEGVAESGGEAITADYALPAGVDRLETLLHIAAKRGDLELVRWLIGQGSAADDRDSADLTPFHAALASGAVPLIEWMLEQYSPKERENAGVTRPTEGESLVSLALSSGKPEAVELLLAHSTVAQVAECWEWLDSVALGHPDPPTAEREFAPLRAALAKRANFRPPPPVTKPAATPAPAEPPASWTAPSPRQQQRPTTPATKAAPAAATMTPERSQSTGAASVSMSPAYNDLPPMKAPAFHALPPTPPATPPPPQVVPEADQAKPARRRRPRRKAPASSSAA